WQDATNYTDGISDGHDPERRRNSEQAFFEYQPIALDVETGSGALSRDRAHPFPNTQPYPDFPFRPHLPPLPPPPRSFRPAHPIPEDGFPGKVVMTAAEASATDGFASVDPTLFAAYVDIDSATYADHKTALGPVLQAAYVAAGADATRATALVTAAL